jgi:Mrp family chromosome partitioning ATPase
MTDQTKIPLPPAGESAQAGAKSLIERAVNAFDLRDLAPPPVPDRLAGAVRKPVRRVPAEALPAQPLQDQPVQAQPEPAAPPVAPSAAPEPEGAPLHNSGPAQAAVPVGFAGAHHRVDRERLREQGLIDPEGAVTTLLEEFRIIKRQLLLNAGDMQRGGGGAAAQRVLICSALPGEGKTWCAINLALSIAAEKESEVLLVDADFAKPSVLGTLGLPGGPGLMDALTNPGADVADFVMGTDIPGLWVLPAGNATTSDSEYLNSSRTPAVFDRLTQGAPHRIVIFDSPPVLAASPAAELAKHVGQAVMVVRADSTAQGAIEDAVSLLAGCPNIELLLNAISFSPSGRRFGTYYGHRG